MADAEQLARSAVERLSEDESLRGRGELSDIGFSPLLDWAVAAVQAYAPKAADADAMDKYTSRVRGVVQAAVGAAEAGKLDEPAALLDFDPADRAKAEADLKALTLGDDPDANGEQLAGVLKAALAAAPAEPAQPAPAEATSTAPEQAAPPEAVPAAQTAPAEAAPVAEPEPEVKKNEPDALESAAQAPNPPPNPETPVPPAASQPRPVAFFDTVKSRVGQAYNSAWGIFKGLNKRRS